MFRLLVAAALAAMVGACSLNTTPAPFDRIGAGENAQRDSASPEAAEAAE